MVAHPLAGVSSHGHQTGEGDEVAGRGECGRVSCGHQKLGAEARAAATDIGATRGSTRRGTTAAVLVRFWRSRDEKRQQLTWLAYAAIFWVSVGGLDVLNQYVVHDPVVD